MLRWLAKIAGLCAFIVAGSYGIWFYQDHYSQHHQIEKLEEKIKRINSSSHEEIKELYKFILNHQKISQKGGGGLGLVDIARKTGNPLDYSFQKYNDKHSFFVNVNDILRSELVIL